MGEQIKRPKIKREVIDRLREMAEAQWALAETEREQQEAVALNAMLDWYEAGK